MARHTYTTQAMVLALHPSGEDSRTYVLFTREVGVVYALAKSIRTQRSKLRYALQTHSFVEVTLVRGKEIWRITGAREIRSFYFDGSLSCVQREVVARICSLLRRLIAGEEPNPLLFDKVMRGFEEISRPGLSGDRLEGVECVVVLQVLHDLGYVSEPSHITALISSAHIGPSLEHILPMRQELIVHINKGLRAADL